MDDLFESLEYGVAALALVHNGCVQVSCSTCDSDFQKEANCLFNLKLTEITDDPVFYSPELDMEFISCPISYIPSIVFDLYDEYMFNKEFNVQQNYKEVSSMFWWFVKTYKSYCNKIEKYKLDKEIKKNKRGN